MPGISCPFARKLAQFLAAIDKRQSWPDLPDYHLRDVCSRSLGYSSRSLGAANLVTLHRTSCACSMLHPEKSKLVIGSR